MRTVFFGAIAFAAVSAAYGGMLDTAWHFDDDPAIREHLGVMNEDWGGWRGLLSGRGLVTATFVLCKRFGGVEDPLHFHVVDLALHLTVVVLLHAVLHLWFRLAGARFSPFWAAAGVLAYGLHPAASQGVIYAAQRGERLAGLLVLAALGAWGRGIETIARPGGRPVRAAAWLAASVAAWRFSLGAKETAVVLPVLMALAVVAWSRAPGSLLAGIPRRWAAGALAIHALVCAALAVRPPTAVTAAAVTAVGAAVILRLARTPSAAAAERKRRLFAAAVGGAFLLQVWALQDVEGQLTRNQDVLADRSGTRRFEGDAARRRSRGPLEALEDMTWRNEYFLTQARVLTRYAAILAWPNHLNVDYDMRAVVTLADAPDVVFLWLAWAAAGFWAVAALCRAGGAVAWGVLWALVGLAPTSSLLRLADLIFEHRLYLPAMGLAWIVCAAGTRVEAAWTARGRSFAVARGAGAARGLGLAALVLLGGFTAARVSVWRDGRTLYADSVRKAPRGFRQRTNLGLGFQERHDLARAERQQLLSVRLFPSGMLWVEPFGNLGNLYFLKGDLDRARRCYETVLSMNGDYKARVMLARVHTARAAVAVARGEEVLGRDELETALAHILQAYRANPRDLRLVDEIEAVLALAVPDPAARAEAFHLRMQALEKAFACHAEGARLARAGRPREAVERLSTALDLFPPLGEAYAERGRVLMDAAGDAAAAARDFEAALSFPPCAPDVYTRLEALYRQRGDAAAAEAVRRRRDRDLPHLRYPREWNP